MHRVAFACALLITVAAAARPLPDDLDVWHVWQSLDADGWLDTDSLTLFESLYDAVHDGRGELVERMFSADAEYVALGSRTAGVCRGRHAVRECLEHDADERMALCAAEHCTGVSRRISVLGDQRVQVARVTEHHVGTGAVRVRNVEIYYVLLERSPDDPQRVQIARLERVRAAVPDQYTLPAPPPTIKQKQ